MSTSKDQTEHTEYYKGDIDEKRHRDALALHDIAPDIPLQEVLDSRADEDPKAVRRLVRKIDIRLVPILALLYTWAFIDRGNLGNVNIAGAGKDLGLKIGNRYSLITMIFFVGYILIDFPGQLLMRKTSPATWLGSITVAWGAISIGQGFVQSWISLLICRILLGVLEGGLVPGCIYLLSIWYTRFEVHKRIAGFYSLGIASGGLSGLLAYGIEKLEGDGGLRGWRWVRLVPQSVHRKMCTKSSADLHH